MLLAEIDEEKSNKIKIPVTIELYRFKELLDMVPTSKYNKDGQFWHFNLAWPTLLALRATLKENIEVGPKLKEWLDGYYNERILPAYNLRDKLEAEGYNRLYPHQRADVQFLATARRAFLANGMGSGKALPVSEPVLTPSGWTTMGCLQVGDKVVGKNGKPTTVTATYEQGVRDIYKMTFKDGTFVLCDKNHLWRVQPVKVGHARIMTTGDLIETGLMQPGTQNARWKIPLVDPVEFEKKTLLLSPYVMGAILGDGSMSTGSITFTSADQEIVARMDEELPSDMAMSRVGETKYSFLFKNHGKIRNNLVRDALKAYGLLGKKSDEKHIPAEYMFSDVEDRIALLQGLMDTDGTVGSSGTISFCTVSRQLACDVRELVHSLGGTAVWNYHKRPVLGNFDPVVLTIRLPEEINPFHMTRKAERVVKATKYPLTRFISKIEFSHREEAKCIVVDADDMLFVTRDYVVTHNSQSVFSTIRYLYEVKKENPFPVLIACPNSTKRQWKREIDEVFPGLTVHVIDGTAAKRKKMFQEPAHVVIINWESLRMHSRLKPYGSIALKKCPEHGGLDPKVSANTCEVHPKELNAIEFKTVIGDEIHRIKDPASKSSRAFKSATGEAEFRFGLSGTIIASGPDDLFSPLNWMYPEAYPSYTKFRDYWCETAYNQYGADTVIGIKREKQQEFFAGIDPILRRMPKELILDFLPPKVYERRDVEMGTKQKKAYDQMRDKMLAELDDDLLVVKSPMVKMMRTLQLASTYGEVEYKDVWDDKQQKIVNKAFLHLSDPSCKLDAFMDDLPDFGDESIAVFANSKQLLNMLAERLNKKGIRYGMITGDQDGETRQMHIDEFQSGEVKLILITISAGGTGITLTKGSTAVFLQRSWSMIENEQAEGRVHRIGSEQYESIRYIDYVTTGTSEEIVFEAVAEKGRQLEFILRDKELMKKYLRVEEIVIDPDMALSEEDKKAFQEALEEEHEYV